jgi:hypothetical protein
MDSSLYTAIKIGGFHYRFAFEKQTSHVMELGSTSRPDSDQVTASSMNQQSHGGQAQRETHTLKVRLWLESENKHSQERKFANYDLLIPDLT